MQAQPNLGKICIIGDSHIKHLRKDIFNGSINNGNAHLKFFNGTNIRQLNIF